MSVSFIKTSNGNLSFHVKGRNGQDGLSGNVAANHPNFDKIYEILQNGQKNREATYKIKERIMRLQSVLGIVREVVGNVNIHDDKVSLQGKELRGTLVAKILEFRKNNYDIKPLCKMLEKLQQNPSQESQEAMWDFVEKAGLIVDLDGDILGYKSVKKNFKDHHTGTFDNSVGKVVSMPRSSVDDNRNNGCSAGLHVGTLQYATTFQNKDISEIVVVKVNPKDVVSVPTYEHEKMRVCEYKVIEVLKDWVMLNQSAYSQPDTTDWHDNDEYTDEDYEDDDEDYYDDDECDDEDDDFDDEEDDLDEYKDEDEEFNCGSMSCMVCN